MSDGDGCAAAPSRLLRVNGLAHQVFAPCDVIFEPCFTLGDVVLAGHSDA